MMSDGITTTQARDANVECKGASGVAKQKAGEGNHESECARLARSGEPPFGALPVYIRPWQESTTAAPEP